MNDYGRAGWELVAVDRQMWIWKRALSRKDQAG
jgi:hypothetical protein